MKSLIKIILIFLITIFAGFWGIIFFFADYGPGENAYTRLLIAFIYYCIVGTVISFLSYPKSKMSLLVVWGVVVVSLLNLPEVFKEGLGRFFENTLMVLVPLLGVLLTERIVNALKSEAKKDN